MRPYSHNGRPYTRFYAFWPRTMSSGQRVWLAAYYIRPGYNGQGLVLSHCEMLEDL